MTALITTLAGAATAWRDRERALKAAQNNFHAAMGTRGVLANLLKNAQHHYEVQCKVTDKLLKELTTKEQAVAQAAEIWGNLKAAEKKE